MFINMLTDHYKYWRKPYALLLLFIISCAFTSNVQQHSTDCVSYVVMKSDTIPASEIPKINKQDIQAFGFNKNVAFIKLKNGDSVFIRRGDLDSFIAKNRKVPPQEYDEIFTKSEIEASYPGGLSKWHKYISNAVQYPKEALENKVQGIIVVQFIVDKEGNKSHVEAISGPTEGRLREEAVRLIENSGKWVPAMQNGKNVKAYKKQEIFFRLPE